MAVVEKSGPALRNAEMELRKCCNHPYLVDGIEDQARHPLEFRAKNSDLVDCQ